MEQILDLDRLRSLGATGLMDSAAEEGFDRFTRLAKSVLNVPIALVSLVAADRQFFKSADGLEAPWAGLRGTPLSHSLCKHVVASGEYLAVSNLQGDLRFQGDQRPGDVGAVAYLGFPLRCGAAVLGSFCVLDTQPHEWTARDVAIVRDLAAGVESEIGLRLATQRATKVAEDAARQDQQVTILLDAIGEGVYGIDTEGRCTFMNRAACAMLGYELYEVLGRDMHDLIHHTRSDGAPYPKSECVILLNGGQSGRVVRLANEVLWRRDGTPFTAEYSSYPVRVDGTLQGSVLTFNDTTLRHDAHKRLAVHLAVSRSFAEKGNEAEILVRTLAAIGTGLGWDVGAFWSLDPDLSSLTCRATWSGTTDAHAFIQVTRSTELSIGRGLPGRVWQTAMPETMPNLLQSEHFQRHDAAKGAGLSSAFAFPVRAGEEILGVMEFFMRLPLREQPQLLQSMVALGELVGQFVKRQRAENELRVTRRAIEAASTGVVISDATRPDLPLIYCNPAFETITGYSPAEALGRSCRFLQGPDTSEQTVNQIREALQEHRECRVILQNYRKNGDPFWNELTISPVFGPEGAPTHFVGVQNDVTERRNAEEALADATLAAEAANSAKSQFIANMSHELRTPMAAVIGYAELLEEEIGDLDLEGTKTLVDDVRKIRGSACHLLDLINGVLDLSKIEAGKMDLHVESFQLGTLMTQVAETVEGLLAKKSNRLVLDWDSEKLGQMHSDPIKLRQCLFNLLSNAAKFTEGGKVTLSVQRFATADLRDQLRFKISDTGIGMTTDQVDRLFTRFTQADSSTTRRFGGTGLGLALTRSFCHMLGGDISVSSEPDRGTTFEFVLPSDVRASTHESQVVLATNDHATQPRGVLVIDDDGSTRDLITRFLAREGLFAYTANNGEEGLRLARLRKPVAILLDVMMPHMDGWAVLAALKACHDLQDIPVIMVSVAEEQGLAFSLGAADYVTKPIDWNRLKQSIARNHIAGVGRKALLIEHDDTLRRELENLLEAEGWAVISADGEAAALKLLDETRPDVVLLDLHTPDPGGLILLSKLRQRENGRFVPVIAITEHSATPAERERLRGQVRKIIETESGHLQELAAELRRISAARPKHGPMRDVNEGGPAHG